MSKVYWFSLFVNYDVLVIIGLTFAFFLYADSERCKNQKYARFFVLFTTCYYVIWYLLSYIIGQDMAQLLFICLLLPILSLVHWIVPFNKNRLVGRFLFLASGIFTVIITIWFVLFSIMQDQYQLFY